MCTRFNTIDFGDLAHCHIGFNEHSLQSFDPAAMDFLYRAPAERQAKSILQGAPGKPFNCCQVAHLDRG